MSQPRGSGGPARTDAAHADDAERAAGQVLPEMAERFPGLPFAGNAVLVPLDQPAGGADEQAKGHVGRGVGQHARRVADRDAARGGGRHVDVVEADREVADHLQPGRASSRAASILSVRSDTRPSQPASFSRSTS